MATAAGIIIATGGLTLLTEVLQTPYVPGNTNVLTNVNWRVIPATAIAAFAFSGLESVNGPAARMLAAMALITSLFFSPTGKVSAIQLLTSTMGYGGATTGGQPKTKP